MSDAQRQAATERMRRSRQRQKTGRRVVRVELRAAEILALMRAGLLSQDCAADADQLGSALVRLIHYMLPDCEAGVILVPFYLHAAGVTRIAKLGWLTPTQAADRQAVCAAFDAFVNRAGLLGVRP
jgi:hypothetical protein